MDLSIDKFLDDGFVAVRGAVAPEVAARCAQTIGGELLGQGIDLSAPDTWSAPVVRVPCPEGPEFAAAGTSSALQTACDRLLGPGRWWRREGVGGSVPVRFPSEDDPGDAGWHIDGSYAVDAAYWVNVQSRDRGLLALFLFSDVGDDDAPTELLAGSHRDVPPVLAPFGAGGVFFGDVTPLLPETTFGRPRVRATGKAGDVFLCHPFLVHRATWPHRGTTPRLVAQPGIALREPFALNPGAAEICPVERAILDALGR